MVAGDEPSDGHVSRVSIETFPEGGIRIDDRIDRRNYTIRTGSDVSPEAVGGDRSGTRPTWPSPSRRTAWSSSPWVRVSSTGPGT